MSPELREQLNRNSCGSAIDYIESLEQLKIEGDAAKEVLFWWASHLSNAPNDELNQVLREGYLKIVNLANTMHKPGFTIHQHTDDIAVDKFAAAMKDKLAKAREKGRSGWDYSELCHAEDLARSLVNHLYKPNSGNYVDVANFCMMLHVRGEDERCLLEELTKRDEASFLSGAMKILNGLGSQSVEQAAKEYAKREQAKDGKE